VHTAVVYMSALCIKYEVEVKPGSRLRDLHVDTHRNTRIDSDPIHVFPCSTFLHLRMHGHEKRVDITVTYFHVL
jgi:hypothetical protein